MNTPDELRQQARKAVEAAKAAEQAAKKMEEAARAQQMADQKAKEASGRSTGFFG
jgi:hypothetical protein